MSFTEVESVWLANFANEIKTHIAQRNENIDATIRLLQHASIANAECMTALQLFGMLPAMVKNLQSINAKAQRDDEARGNCAQQHSPRKIGRAMKADEIEGADFPERDYTIFDCKRNIEMTPLCKIEVTHPWVLGSREVHRGGVVDEQAGVQPP